jgi:RNA polymerase sigma factor (sigma-70 family)
VLPSDATVGPLLEQLRSGSAEIAWREFLTSYSELIFGIVRTFAKDADGASDCFLYVCEKLAERNYRRLLAFKSDGTARFTTWLRAVVRNLCLDSLRSRFGRKQMFRSVASLPSLEQEIFASVFQRGLSIEQAWLDLRSKGIDMPFGDFEKRATRIRSLLTSRQLWLLSTAGAVIESLDSESTAPELRDVVDPSPDPEKLALLRDTHLAILKGLQRLDEGDRLILRLRFFQGLGLLEVADLVGLKDAQTADRRIRDALQKLREELGVPKPIAVKPKSVSV